MTPPLLAYQKLSLPIGILLLLGIFISSPTKAQDSEQEGGERISLKKSSSHYVKKYMQLLKKFGRQHCSPGTEGRYWKLVRDYKGNGNFVPVLSNGKLDRKTIRKYLPTYNKKINWIEGIIEKLEEDENFKSRAKLVQELQDRMKKLVEIKRLYFEASKKGRKLSLRLKSRRLLNSFRKEYENVMDKLYFFRSFHYPVNHFELRKKYDLFNKREDMRGKRKANGIYFYRKIVEDGSYNPNYTGSDLYLRANLSMNSHRLDKEQDFLPEEIRYDLSSAFRVAKKFIKRGKENQIERFKEWKTRTQKRLDFYISLLEDKVKVADTDINTSAEFVKARSKAKYRLKTYVYDKQEDVYEFWKDRPELMRYLYVMDTILYNEVGSIDGRDALERRDVAKVVINRHDIDFYSTLSDKSELGKRLKDLENREDYRWLNILFKRGEFSFTYYFISATVRVFCPDQTKRGRYLHRENARIAMEMINKEFSDFPAVRYFSRAAMLGRINMAFLWKGFTPIPERPGLRAKNEKSLLKKYKEGSYSYLYHFTDPEGVNYKVLDFEGDTYVLPIGEEKVFKYRNPNYFRYFRKR